jgi:hypothetical protein
VKLQQYSRDADADARSTSVFYLTTVVCHFLLSLSHACGQSADWGYGNTTNERSKVTADICEIK